MVAAPWRLRPNINKIDQNNATDFGKFEIGGISPRTNNRRRMKAKAIDFLPHSETVFTFSLSAMICGHQLEISERMLSVVKVDRVMSKLAKDCVYRFRGEQVTLNANLIEQN